MQYDPIKRSLGKVFNKTPHLRILFYQLLNLLLLRTWHVKRALRRWIKTSNLKNPMILDAGSGFGQYTYSLTRMLPEATIDAVDVKEEQILDCNRFFKEINQEKVHFSIADLTKYVKPDAYDLILSVDVMEHILEDEQVFQNFFTSLKPGGMLLVSTPSDQGGSDVHDHDEEDSFIDEHVRDGYGYQEITGKLKRVGFEQVHVAYTYGKSGQTGWRLSMKYPIRMLNISKLFFLILPFYYLITYPFALICNKLDVSKEHKAGTGLIVTALKPK